MMKRTMMNRHANLPTKRRWASFATNRVTRLAGFTSLGLLALLMAGLLSQASATEPEDAIPTRPEARWWKGNLHTHTYWSDGDDFPEMVAEWYRTHGYNFLGLSDHNIQSEGIRWVELTKLNKKRGELALKKYLKRYGPDWVETRGNREEGSLEVRLKPLSEFRALLEERGKFLMIPSEEISDRAEGVPVHMNVTNLAEVIQPLGGKTVREAMTANTRAVKEQAKKHGREIIIHLNHPNFYFAITAEDLAAVVSERFFEVFNGHPRVWQLGDATHPSVDRLWDIANTIRLGQLQSPPLYGLGSDDSHNYHDKPVKVGKASPGRGWVMVRATHLTPESLIRAIKRGDFYASSGVTLEDVAYDPEQGELKLSIQPQEGAEYTTRFIGTLAGYDTTSSPRTDEKGEPLRVTQNYSPEVGQTFATVSGLHPSYKLTGKELYVRAVVTSTLPPVNPSFENQKRKAWTQPVGWKKLLDASTR